MYKKKKKDNRVTWQKNCDNAIRNKTEVILSSPTGSGKTDRYERWAFDKPERPIFITSPIKALSNQKFRTLQAQGYKVGLETGDIKYFPPGTCDIICCTQEIYNNKYREYNNCTVIIDELSYIFDNEQRTRAYVESLRFSQAKNIMLCSATFGNPNDIKEYVDRISGRNFFLYQNDKRLTTLEYVGEMKKDNIKDSLVVAYSKERCELIAVEIYKSRVKIIDELTKRSKVATRYLPNRPEILKVAQKYNIKNKELIELSSLGVVYYYGNLYPKEKLFIEELFEKRLIDTIVGTDALALGVNFPIKNVIFTQLNKSSTNGGLISKNLFEQLAGRAGRKGFFDTGYVYYCDDFEEIISSFGGRRKRKNSLKEPFFYLVSKAKEKMQISLSPDIKNILLEKKTIEQEAMDIVEYSTVKKDYNVECQNIRNMIEYVKSFDITYYYLESKFCNLDFSEGLENAIKDCNESTKTKVRKLFDKLQILQSYFERDIGEVYHCEFSPEKNCEIFTYILMGEPLDTLIYTHGKNFHDLLLLRKYLNTLPEKHTKSYNLFDIDNAIDNMDYTVLHPEDFKMDKTIHTNVNDKKEIEGRKKISCPNFFDILSANGKKYVKLLNDGDNMILCDYTDEKRLGLHVVSSDTEFKHRGFLPAAEKTSVFKRIDMSSFEFLSDECSQKIEGMKTFIQQSEPKKPKQKTKKKPKKNNYYSDSNRKLEAMIRKSRKKQ